MGRFAFYHMCMFAGSAATIVMIASIVSTAPVAIFSPLGLLFCASIAKAALHFVSGFATFTFVGVASIERLVDKRHRQHELQKRLENERNRKTLMNDCKATPE